MLPEVKRQLLIYVLVSGALTLINAFRSLHKHAVMAYSESSENQQRSFSTEA